MSSHKLKNFLNSPFQSFFSIWVPVLFSMIAEPLTGLADTAFIARLGAEPLAALGVGTVVLTSGLWLFNFLSVGSQTEVSQANGRDNLDDGKRFGSLALLLAGSIGLVMAILAHVFGPVIASLMGADGSVHDYALTYIRIRAFGGPAVLLTMTCFGILYGLADMRSPLLIALVVNGLNIFLDWLLIFGIGPLPVLGIGGAAYATTISQWVGALWCLLKVQEKIGFTCIIKTGDIGKLLTIGRDMFLRTGSLTLFLLLATRLATRLGTDSGAAHQAIRQIWIFTSLFLDAAAVTAQSVVGYYFGGSHCADALRAAKSMCYWGVCIGSMLLVLMLIGRNHIAVVLVPVSSQALFTPAWIIAALFQPVAALAFVTDGIHWGTGDFTFLRNVVILATLCCATVIGIMGPAGTGSLPGIWLVTGCWVLIRAIFGILRLWPGIGKPPLSSSVTVSS